MTFAQSSYFRESAYEVTFTCMLGSVFSFDFRASRKAALSSIHYLTSIRIRHVDLICQKKKN